MVKRIVATERLDCEHLLGTFLDESHYDVLIEEDTDCYMPPDCDNVEKATCGMSHCDTCEKGNDELRIAFKFRKNFFTKEECDEAYIGLRGAAHQSFNRGLAAGPRTGDTGNIKNRDWVTPYQHEVLDFFMNESANLNNFLGEENISLHHIREKHKNYDAKREEETRGYVWLTTEIQKEYENLDDWFDRWADGLGNLSPEERKEEAIRVSKEWVSSTNYAKPVFSGVAGWYDRYPRIPYGRATSYTEQNFETFKKAFPFLQSLNKGFKELLPWRWGNQKAEVDKIDPAFVVPGTVFTTLTVNKTFRTAAHYDAGDLSSGLSNLLVLGSGDYTGGYLVFPEYRIAVNVRPGDLLLVNNHEIIHGNTPIVLNNKKAERISVVCYFRENMTKLKSYKYESLRRQFIEERRLDITNPNWRPLWNGISNDMWKSQEWAEYLLKHNMEDEDGFVGTEYRGVDSFV